MDHVTAVLVLPVTVLVKVAVAPSWTLEDTGETVTTTGGGGGATNVTAAVADDEGLDAEVARMVTLAEAGIVVGAV